MLVQFSLEGIMQPEIIVFLQHNLKKHTTMQSPKPLKNNHIQHTIGPMRFAT